MSSSGQQTYNPLSKRWYLTAAPYNNYIYSYVEGPETSVLVPIPGLTEASCPINRVLRETGRRLFPEANPGVSNTMVAVFDETSFLKGYIDPNATIFVVYTTDIPYFWPRATDPITGLPNAGPPVLTDGPIITSGYLAGSFISSQLYNPGFNQVLYTNTGPNADVFIDPFNGNVFQVDITPMDTALTGTITCYLRSASAPDSDMMIPEGEIVSILFIIFYYLLTNDI